MTDSPPLQDLQKTLGQQRLVTFEPGRAAIEYLAGAHMCHSGGVVQGGFICGWIDAAMAHAAMAGGGDMTPMSLELKVSFFPTAMNPRQWKSPTAVTRPGFPRKDEWHETPDPFGGAPPRPPLQHRPGGAVGGPCPGEPI
ncbi:MAG: hypothetical protein LW695_03450 [Phenylobacterium sp.]|nr:hypothetical protein [Phenylobacterium sp.]